MSALRRIRNDNFLSVEDLAEKSGVSASVIYDIEAGKTTRPHPKNLFGLARALGCKPSEIDPLTTREAA